MYPMPLEQVICQYFAVKLFDITVNSMADERTASTITWLNSTLRTSQKSSTLVSQVQVRQWALMGPKRNKKPTQKLTVKFRELMSSYLEAEIDGHTRKRKHSADSAQTQEDLDPVSDDDGWLDEEEDPGFERDPLCQGSDSQTFVGSQDAHLDSPCLLDLLSDRPVEGSHTAPPQNESDTSTLPLGGPVQWAFTLS
ncbi:hypothetical protein EV424DRAFT_1557871 [Suillus variegatus]|nr:hypothetical protein EV424DRAFT_1557871 [Suillus variegatus]